MTRGRKPTPTPLKIVNGNPGKRKLPKNEPKPVVEIPACPDHLSESARKEWDRITAELHKLGLLTQLDVVTLSVYCETFAIWVEAKSKVKNKGRVIKTSNGYPVLNPWHSIETKAAIDLKAIGTEFGFSPSARSRIDVENPDGEEVDPLESFTKRRA